MNVKEAKKLTETAIKEAVIRRKENRIKAKESLLKARKTRAEKLKKFVQDWYEIIITDIEENAKEGKSKVIIPLYSEPEEIVYGKLSIESFKNKYKNMAELNLLMKMLKTDGYKLELIGESEFYDASVAYMNSGGEIKFDKGYYEYVVYLEVNW